MEQVAVSSQGSGKPRLAELDWSPSVHEEVTSPGSREEPTAKPSDPPAAEAPAAPKSPPIASPTTAASVHFGCTDCGRRSPIAADCSCGGGELVDLDKPEFREMIVEIEDRRAETHKQRLLWAGVAMGIVTIVGVLVTVPEIILAIPLPVPFANPIKFLVLGILAATTASKVLEKIVPARRHFPELVARRNDIVLPSRLRAIKPSTWIAVAVVLALGTTATIVVPILRERSAIGDREHQKGVARAFEALDDCMVNEYAEVCGKQLTALYEAVDTRREDAGMRSTLETKFGCETKCKTSALDTSFGDVRKAAVNAHIAPTGSFREFRPGARAPKDSSVDAFDSPRRGVMADDADPPSPE